MSLDNQFEIRGDKTAIFLRRKNGEILETLIDTADLSRVSEFPYAWCALRKNNTPSYYVKGILRDYDGQRKTVYLHRWLFNNPEGFQIDHINHDTLNNTRGNLRIVTPGENSQNKKGAYKTSKSGIRGVFWDKRSKKWNAHFQVDKKKVNLGLFQDIEEAEKAVIEARRKHMPYSTCQEKRNVL